MVLAYTAQDGDLREVAMAEDCLPATVAHFGNIPLLKRETSCFFFFVLYVCGSCSIVRLPTAGEQGVVESSMLDLLLIFPIVLAGS